jgi:hypothetical protein
MPLDRESTVNTSFLRKFRLQFIPLRAIRAVLVLLKKAGAAVLSVLAALRPIFLAGPGTKETLYAAPADARILFT